MSEYGEPWRVEVAPANGGDTVHHFLAKKNVPDSNGYIHSYDISQEDKERVVLCVNLLAGISSARLKEPLNTAVHLLLAALRGDDTAIFGLRDFWQECPPESFVDQEIDLQVGDVVFWPEEQDLIYFINYIRPPNYPLPNHAYITAANGDNRVAAISELILLYRKSPPPIVR